MPSVQTIPPNTTPYQPGKAIILSRLPAQDHFTVEQAALHSGWSPSFIRARCNTGELPAQEYNKPGSGLTRATGKHSSYRIHIDDLVLFILRNGNGKYTDEKIFRDAATILRTWPAWMRREMIKWLERSLA